MDNEVINVLGFPVWRRSKRNISASAIRNHREAIEERMRFYHDKCNKHTDINFMVDLDEDSSLYVTYNDGAFHRIQILHGERNDAMRRGRSEESRIRLEDL